MQLVLPGGAILEDQGNDLLIACRPQAGVWGRNCGENVTYGDFEATYSSHVGERIQGPKVRLKNYKQEDNHSCGFVAALTIARHFYPDIAAKEVLKAVQPDVDYGVDLEKLDEALNKLKIKTDYRKDLTVNKLKDYIKRGVPVIVSVWPDEYGTDHWVIVQAITDKFVYLTNYRPVSLEMFKEQWSDMDMRGRGNSREGIVCSPEDKSAAMSHDVSSESRDGQRGGL